MHVIFHHTITLEDLLLPASNDTAASSDDSDPC